MRHSFFSLMLISLAVVLCLSVAAADWPQFLGPTANSLAPDTGLNKNWRQQPPPELWRVALSDNGYAGPSVAEGKVFIIDHRGSDDVVRALDLQTGRQVWEYAYPDTNKPNYGFARSTPVFSEGMLYVYSRLGLLTCLNAGTGQAQWSKDLGREFGARRPKWDFAISPLVEGDRLVIVTGSDRGNVIVLNKRNGSTVWVGGTDDIAGYATPVAAEILGRQQYVIFGGATVFGVDRESGKALWSFPWPTRHDVNAAVPVVQGNFVFISSGYGTGCCLIEITPQGVREHWRNTHLVAHFNSPIYYKGYLWGIGDPGNLVCIGPQSGQLMWKQGGFGKGGLIIADDVIIALGGDSGDLVMVAADSARYQELGRLRPLGGKSWTAPILADGKLIIRNEKEMVCLGLK